jgi:copper chaperone
MQQIVFAVTGMTCGHCVSAVRAEVARIPGVTEVDVELESGKVTVATTANIEMAALRDAVAEAGYAIAEP